MPKRRNKSSTSNSSAFSSGRRTNTRRPSPSLEETRRAASPSKGRIAAVEILNRVLHKGAFANLVLPVVFRRRAVNARDRAFVHELTLSVLRHKTFLEWQLQPCCSKPLGELEPVVKCLLLLGAGELLLLGGTPAPVACSQWAEAAKKLTHPGIVAVVNAVLRRLASTGAASPLPDPQDAPVQHLAVRHSHPEWLVERWVAQFGLEETANLCRANNQNPVLSLRVNLLRTTRGEVLSLLRRSGFVAREGKLCKESVVVEQASVIEELPGFREGFFTVQDEASTYAGVLLDPRPEDTILDACAAPGGKATHLAERMKNRGRLLAVDLHANRLDLVKEQCERLGLTNVETIAGDFVELAAELPAAQGVLVDAPCTGTGVLRRKPDIRWHLRPEQIAELSLLQLRLIRAAASKVVPGGKLVYSTCSLEREENEDLVAQFLAEQSDFALLRVSRSSEEGWVRFLPQDEGTDGMSACVMVRNA